MIGPFGKRYRVIERLGGGGMGEVYRAEDTDLQRSVALKVLRPDALGGEEARARLLREARAAAALSHPGIAVVYEIGEQEGAPAVPFIAMEYVAGRTLAARLAEGPLGLDAAVDLARQAGEALAEAHARGVVHRDVKPSNVMLTESGRLKLLDFGLACQQVPAPEDEKTWSHGRPAPQDQPGLVGTLAYMAPEQALGAEVDGRADVFSLGALLYEAVSGRRPFAGKGALQVLDAVLRREPPPLAAPVPDPRLPGLEAVVLKMLAKRAEDRYSMAEACADLLDVQRGHSPAHAPAAVSRPSRSIVVTPFRNISGDGEDDWLGTGIAETVTADLKGVAGLEVLGRERVSEVLRRLEGWDEGDDALPVRVARELGARWVLSGGVQRAGDALRVTARVSEVATGAIVRTTKLDGRLTEIFDLQDRIARELAAALAPAAETSDRGPEETHVLEAYEAFAKGVLNLRRETYESLDRAAFLFERAGRLDPGYALAHLELATVLGNKADYLAIPELHERALAGYRRALELRPGLVRAWREMGTSLVALGRDEEGVEAIRRAIDLDAGDSGALAAMGRALFVGQARFREAMPFFEKALEHNPQGGWYALQLAHCAALLRDFERGEAAAQRAVALQEAFLSGQQGVLIVGAYMRVGHLAALQQREAEAVGYYRRELEFVERVDHALRGRISIELQMRLGASLGRLGKAAEARAAIDAALGSWEQRLRLGADEPFTRYYAACAHALRGDLDEAVASLEKAARQRRRFTVERARLEPELAALRDLPRFRALVG